MPVMRAGPKERAGFKEPPVKYTPASSAMNSASPMTRGATKVALCFSAASMKMVESSMKVRNISMNKPLTTEVSLLSAVLTVRGPGKSPETTAAAMMAPSSWATMSRTTLIKPTVPTRAKASVT